MKHERSKNPAEEYDSESIASSHEGSLLLGLYKLKVRGVSVCPLL